MPTAYAISVSRETIERATQRDSRHCMIAEAIRDARPDAQFVSVDIQTIRFSIPFKRIRCTYLTPRIAQLALVRFDQGRSLEPFQFHCSSRDKRLCRNATLSHCT